MVSARDIKNDKADIQRKVEGIEKRNFSTVEIKLPVISELEGGYGEENWKEKQDDKLDSCPQLANTGGDEVMLESNHVHECEQTSEWKPIESSDNSLENIVCLSKETILLDIEKMESEIDFVEKELANLMSEVAYPGFTKTFPSANEKCAHGSAQTEYHGSSDLQNEPAHNHERIQGCLRSLRDEVTVTSMQKIDKVDSPCLDSPAVLVELENDDIVINNCEVQSLMHQSLNVIDVPLKSSEFTVEEEALHPPEISPDITHLPYYDGSFLSSEEEGPISTCYQAILHKNQELAAEAGNSLLHLVPSNLSMTGGKLYSSPDGAPNWIQNDEFHQSTKEEMKEKLARCKKLYRFKERFLALKYQALSKIWKQEHFGLLQRKDRVRIMRKNDSDYRNAFTGNNQRSSSRLRLLSYGIAKYEALLEDFPVVRELLLQSPSEKGRLRMPAMILDQSERSSQRFVTINGLVEDPVAVEQVRKTINPWTLEERQVFLEKYAIFHKQFAKIASYLPRKTVADCIEFYYRNHKSEDFEKAKSRKQQQKMVSGIARFSPYLATTLWDDRFGNSTSARVDALSLVAALASSSSLVRDCLKPPRHNLSNSILQSCLRSSSDHENIKDLKERKLSSISEMKSGHSTLATEAGGGSECALALCSLGSATVIPSEKGDIDRVGGNDIFSGPCFTRRRHGRPKNGRSFRLQNDTAKATREDVDLLWNDHEKESFLYALKLHGKNFNSIALHIGTKTAEQCKKFFIKTRKRLDLDRILELRPAHAQTDHEKGRGYSEATRKTSEKVSHLSGDVIMADVPKFPKDQPQCNEFDFKSVEVLTAHSELDIECEAYSKVICELCTDNGVNQANSSVALVDEKGMEHDTCTVNAPAQDLEHQKLTVDVQLKDTVPPKGHSKEDVLISSTLSWKMDLYHSDVSSVPSNGKSCADAERSDALEFEVKKAKEDINTAVKIAGLDKSTVELKESFAGKASLQEDVSMILDVAGFEGDRCKKLPRQDIDINESSTDLVNASVGALVHVVQPHLGSTSLISDSPNARETAKCHKAPTGGEAKLRREPACWTPEEKKKFASVIQQHGKNWSILQENLPTKSLTQIKTYFQNSKAKLTPLLAEMAGDKGDKVRVFKHKADDSDTNRNAGSLGHVSQRSSIVPEINVLKSSVAGSKSTASTVMGSAIPSLGQNKQDFKGIQTIQLLSSAGLPFKSSVLADPDPAQTIFPGRPGSHAFNASSSATLASSSDLATRSYDCHPNSYTVSRPHTLNLQSTEHVTHDQVQAKSLRQDNTGQNQKQQDLLAMVHQEQHIMHLMQQQRVDIMSESPVPQSQLSYFDPIQARRIQQLQQGSLLSGLQFWQPHQLQNQNKDKPLSHLHQALQMDMKHSQVHEVGRGLPTHHSAAQTQSSTNKWDLFAPEKQKTISQQVARPSQLSEVQAWDSSQQELLHHKKQEQLIQLCLQQERSKLQHQLLLNPPDKQSAQDHQQLISQQFEHRISDNSPPNQLNRSLQNRNDQQQLRQDIALQHLNTIPVKQLEISSQGPKLLENGGDTSKDCRQREAKKLELTSASFQGATFSITTSSEVQCQASQVDNRVFSDTISEPKNRKNIVHPGSILVETQTALTPRGGDIKLFGQSLLSQPSSAAVQSGTISTCQTWSSEDHWFPLSLAPDFAAKKLSKSYKNNLMKAGPSSSPGDSSTTEDLHLPTWSYAGSSGEINECNAAWSGLQINTSAAVARDAEYCDGLKTLPHGEVC